MVSGENDRQIAFVDGGNWQENRNGTAIAGTYVYQQASDSRHAALNLDEPGFSEIVSLNFTSTNNGTFAYTGGRTGQGYFTLNQQPDPGGDPEPGGTPDPDALAPASLNGKTMLGTLYFTSTGPVGQTHTYTFSAGTFHDSDSPEESDGRYTWQPNGNNATLQLNYTKPASFSGDTHELNMRFNTATSGDFNSVYTKDDGTVIQINGTFEFQ